MFHFNVLVVSWKGKIVTRKALHPRNDCRHWIVPAGSFLTPPFMGIEGGKQRLPSKDVCENDMLNYCREVSCLLSNISVQVKAAQGKVAERFLHEVRPGDFVVIRDHRRKSWKSKRWLEPFQVLLVTHMAVKVAERATWVHVNHAEGCRPLRRRSNRWRRFNASVNKC